jgi:S1-C subfamily serine protease
MSCTVISNSSVITKPPTKQFVKIYKKVRVTRCHKKPTKKNTKKCETKIMASTGSGLVLDLVEEYTTVISAGHVCLDGIKLLPEDETYTYSWSKPEIAVQNYTKKIYKAKLIIAEEVSLKKEVSDLCALVVPGLPKGNQRVKIALRPPRVGEDIYYIGAPLGIYHPPTALIVRGVFSGKIDKISSLASMPVEPGASGSPVLSLDNRIYGVVFAVHSGFHVASLVTNYSKTKNFILRTQKLLELAILEQNDI